MMGTEYKSLSMFLVACRHLRPLTSFEKQKSSNLQILYQGRDAEPIETVVTGYSL